MPLTHTSKAKPRMNVCSYCVVGILGYIHGQNGDLFPDETVPLQAEQKVNGGIIGLLRKSRAAQELCRASLGMVWKYQMFTTYQNALMQFFGPI